MTIAAPGAENPNPDAKINRFGSPNDNPGAEWYYESPQISTELSKERLKVPDGYLASTGSLSLKGWMYVRAKPNSIKQFERGYAVVLLNGQKFGISEGVPDAAEETGAGGKQWTLDQNLLLQAGLSGEVSVALTTSLNSVTGSIRLNCARTLEHENAWARKMFGLFASAYRARVDEYEDAQTRASLDNNQWAGSFPSTTAREIERRELKRGIVNQMTLNNLDALGTAVLVEPPENLSERPPVPTTVLGQLPDYTKIVGFFEQAFDWTNMAYTFAPYIFGRRSEWPSLAVADDADAQFKSFLSSGAARVQVPVRRGFEAHVEYFFGGLGVTPLGQRIPWLGSMRSIAEDLAAEAREGFEVGQGTISVTLNSTTVIGTGTLFRDPEDLSREIRVAGKLHVIESVVSSVSIRLTRPYGDQTEANLSYETGGIVVGPVIEVALPTTLVAIDVQGLALPQFPARYS